MAAATGTLIGLLLILPSVSSQTLNLSETVSGSGICNSTHCQDLDCLSMIRDCVTIVGNLTFLILGPRKVDMFENLTFPNLREVTGYMAVYQVPYLESVGQLFPNLVRVRGRDLLRDYALIVYDIAQLTEIGLYRLLKVDRGGVIMSGGPDTCYVDTINWEMIAPRYRRVISPAEDRAHCNKQCRCSFNKAYDTCWNNKKCQRFTEGPEALHCHPECLGCQLTNQSQCWLCRHYTHEGQCVPECPKNSILLEDNQYCIKKEECFQLGRFVWNNTCISSCPYNYTKIDDDSGGTCQLCINCDQHCNGNLAIHTITSIQAAHRCVYINGSLKIHIKVVPGVIEEMRLHLSRIEEVSDYVLIRDSTFLTSLDILPSLRRIRGRKLFDRKYSLMIRENSNLESVFTASVYNNLKIDNGALGVTQNPMLCASEIDKLIKLFPTKSNTVIDIPNNNGYSGICKEVMVGLNVSVVNATSAIVKFIPVLEPKTRYSVLYARVDLKQNTTVVPESCSKYEWHTAYVYDSIGRVQLNSLHPASTYLVCIESVDLKDKHVARSAIVNFSTAVGKPEPPFIVELVASSPHEVVLHWVDHIDYCAHIIRYELDVKLIEIDPVDIFVSNQCKNFEEEFMEVDIISRHAVLMRPPPHYGKGCESMCGVLSTAPRGAMVQDYFDICHSIEFGCNDVEEIPGSNTSFGNFVRSAFFNKTKSPKKEFRVGNLAPYRDYRFRLRACTRDQCSRFARGVVRTLPSVEVDVPTINYIEAESEGLITVSWEAPVVSNGPVLAYIVEIMPGAKISDVGVLLNQRWCVPANQTSTQVQFEKANGIRLCSLSLASVTGCTEYQKITKKIIPSPKKIQFANWIWGGVLFAIPLCIISVVLGYLWKHFKTQSDTVPLVNITSTYRNDSEPPTFSMLDFTPSLHLRNSDWDQS